MNWPVVIILGALGLLCTILIIRAAERNRRGGKRRGKQDSIFHRYRLRRRSDDGLLVPPDFHDEDSAISASDSCRDSREVFALLEQSEELENLLSYTPSGRRVRIWGLVYLSFGIVLLTFSMIASSESDASSILIYLGTISLIIGVYDLWKFYSSPLERLPAIIVHKSEKSYPGNELMGGGVFWIVCVETQGGDIEHYQTSFKIFQKIKQEDIGVAYVRGEHMLDFESVALKEA